VVSPVIGSLAVLPLDNLSSDKEQEYFADGMGQVLYHARRYDDSLRVNQRGLEMYPNSSDFYWNMADVGCRERNRPRGRSTHSIK
jgi:hypothetical protein